MVIDFKDLKEIVKSEIVEVFDHATVFNQNTPHVKLAKTLADSGHKVLLVDYQPTRVKSPKPWHCARGRVYQWLRGMKKHYGMI